MSNQSPAPLPAPRPVLAGISRFGSKLAMIFMAGGIVAILLGWNGASGYTSLVAQFPYLISGGLLGLSLVTIGVGLMITQSAREDRTRLEAKLSQLVELGLAGAPAAITAPSDVSGLVVAGTASYHLPTCRLVDGREELSYITPEEAASRSLSPCRVCSPAGVETTNVSVK